MTAHEYLKRVHEACHFYSRERTAEASTSELRRWLENGSVLINDTKPKPWEEVTFPVNKLVLFPGSRGSVTLI